MNHAETKRSHTKTLTQVNTTEQTYDHADWEGFRAALDEIASGLLIDATKSLSAN
jgi:hypothetical protein